MNMNEKQIRLSKITISISELKNMFAKSHNFEEVCTHLGIDCNKNNMFAIIKKVANEEGINTDHFTSDLAVPKAHKRKALKQFNMNADNRKYYEAMKNNVNITTWHVYRYDLGKFFESLGDTDFLSVSPDQILAYGRRREPLQHLSSTLKFVIKHDINNAQKKVNRQILIWLATQR